MRSPTQRYLDGLLAIGPHRLDAQLQALTAYAARTDRALAVLWALLPGENAATDTPDSGFPIVAFDDEIAGFTAEECRSFASADDAPDDAVTDWHVAHPIPQPKSPTTHLPVYGRAGERETAADALLCACGESLDRQLARIEAYAMRSAIRLRGVYVATDPANLQLLLRDFSASNRALGTGLILTVAPQGEVRVHE